MQLDDEGIEPNQEYQIDCFRPEDAPGIAKLFHAVYGPGYPFDAFYIPERITEENRNGNIHSVVARTARGDIIAHGALYRSSPHFSELYEGGQYLVRKSYRNSFAMFKIQKYIFATLVQRVRPAGIFGESVCNHVISQKFAARAGSKDTALEVDLMPSEAYTKEWGEDFNRVSCLIQFVSVSDRPHEVVLPVAYREQIDRILNECGVSRAVKTFTETVPPEGPSEVMTKHFNHAGVTRSNVIRAGENFDSVVTGIEEQAKQEGSVVLQFFVNLNVPWIDASIEMLRERGYFFGGYVPRWFDSDGLLMQKLLIAPHFEGISLYSDAAKQLRDYVEADWKRVTVRPS